MKEKILLITDRNINTSLGRTAVHLHEGLNKFIETDLLVITSQRFFKTLNMQMLDKYTTIHLKNFYLNSLFSIAKYLQKLDFSQYSKIILTHQFLGYLVEPIKKINPDIEITTFVHDIFPSILFAHKLSYRLLDKFYLKPIFSSDSFVFNSNHSYNTFKNFFKLSEFKYRICGVTIAIDDFYKIDNVSAKSLKERYNLPNRKTFLNVGITEWRKNLKIFLELAKKYPDCNFVKVGGFDKELSKLCKNLDNVYVFNGIGISEIRDMYNLADVYVMPSFFEGFSITGLEAMNCGTPVVGTFMSAHKEVYKDLISFVNNPYDVEEFISKIEDIDNHPINRKKLDEILEKYSISNVSKEIYNLMFWS